MSQWDSNFSSNPTSSSDPAQGGLDIQKTRKAIVDAMQIEHQWDYATMGEFARHREGSSKAWLTDEEPINKPDPTGETNVLDTNDKGRIWIDNTNGRYVLKVWDGTKFQPLSTETVGQIAFFPRISDGSDGWLLCDGTELNPTSNPEYAALCTYLKGTLGSVILPNLQGYFVRCAGESSPAEKIPDPTSLVQGTAYPKTSNTFKTHDHSVDASVPDHDHNVSIADHTLTVQGTNLVLGQALRYINGVANDATPSLFDLETTWSISQHAVTETEVELDVTVTEADNPTGSGTETAPDYVYLYPHIRY